jgi:outer membrane protein assembly factor BamB
MKQKLFSLGWLALGLLVSPVVAAPAQQLWTASLGGDAKWHQLTGLGSLLVGTDKEIVAISPEDGKVLWKRDDIKKSNRNNAREIPGTPVLICNTYDGMMNSKVTFMAIDYQAGTTIWTSPAITTRSSPATRCTSAISACIASTSPTAP